MLTKKNIEEILAHFPNQVQKHAALTALKLANEKLKERSSGSKEKEDKD